VFSARQDVRFPELSAPLRMAISTTLEGLAPGRAWNDSSSSVARSPSRIRPGTRTVLIVEDDPTLQRMMGRQLTGMNVRVMAASHYGAALALLASCTPDLACVDIGLPTESGFELCEYMRGPLGLGSLPIMMTSESGRPADMAYAEEAGADAFLLKPFSMPELGAHVEALLEGDPPRPAQRFRHAA